MKSTGITEALSEVFFCPVGMGEDPVDFVGEGVVEDAWVVSGNDEVDIGFEEGVNGVMSGIGHAADTEIGGGTGFDDGAELGEVV